MINQKLIAELGRTQRLDLLRALRDQPEGMTVKELAARFGMSYMGIKQHCLLLDKEGYLSTHRRPKPVGRPELVYRLTVRALELFESTRPEADNRLALELLDVAGQMFGAHAPAKLLYQIFHRRTLDYLARVGPERDVLERAVGLVRCREAEGHLAVLETDGVPRSPGGPAVPQDGPDPESAPPWTLPPLPAQAAADDDGARDGALDPRAPAAAALAAAHRNGAVSPPPADDEEEEADADAAGAAAGAAATAAPGRSPLPAPARLPRPPTYLRIIEHRSPLGDLLRRHPVAGRWEQELFARVLGRTVRRTEETAPGGVYRCCFEVDLVC